MFTAEGLLLHSHLTVHPLCRQLTAQGHRLLHVNLDDPNRQCLTVDTEETNVPVANISSGNFRKDRNRIGREFESILYEFQPHVIHTWGWQAGIVAREFLKDGTRHVHTILNIPSGRNLGRIEKVRINSAEQQLFQQANALIYSTTWIQLDVEKSGSAINKASTTLFNGLDVATDRAPDFIESFRMKLNLSSDSVLATQIAPLATDMGHRDLIKATGRLSNVPGLDLHMCFVGRGPLEKTLAKETARAGLAEKVHYVGQIPVRQLTDVIRASDILVHCVSHTGLPGILPMAMLAARPVICWNHGCAGELVDHETGILLEPGDLAGLTEALRVFSEVEELRRQLGQTGHNRFQSRFSLDRMADRLAKLYSRMTNGS